MSELETKILSDKIKDKRAKARFMKAVGRPTKYDPKFCTQIKALFANGMTNVQVAAELGISEKTYYHWRTIHYDFSQAHYIAKGLSRSRWDDIIFDNLDNKMFNDRLCEANYRRNFKVSEDSKVELADFKLDDDISDRIMSILTGMANQEISPSQAKSMIETIKMAQDVTDLPKLQAQLDVLLQRSSNK